MMNRIDAIGNQPQVAFKARTANRKQIHEFIDKSYDLTMAIINKDRPTAENKIRAMYQEADDLNFNNIMKQILKDTFINKPLEKIQKLLFKI